ncbi:uncharacterized protein [Paramormyrops kingsleyae]|uniref:uncharacterized protein n=1 Tax=Paramormyrops kingsleyae TaxID=1676925 RepID=UPI003B97C32F
MGDRTFQAQDTPSHQGHFYPLAKGQKSAQHFCHDPLESLGHLESVAEVSGCHGKLNSCAARGDGECMSEDGAGLSRWINPPLGHADMGAVAFGDGPDQGKPFRSSEDPSEWRSAYLHHGTFQGAVGDCEQKLDSFSEAFPRRNAYLFQNGGRGVIFTSGCGAGKVSSPPGAPATPTPPTTHPSPLVLCSPPTSLSLPSLSPSKNAPQFPTAQTTPSAQLDVTFSSSSFSAGLQPYYLSHTHAGHLPGTALAGKCPPLLWLQQSGHPAGQAEPFHPQHQEKDSDPSLMYPGETQFLQKHSIPSHQDEYSIPDHCNLQTPLSSPPEQYPQSCVSFLQDPNPAPPADNPAAWHLETADRGGGQPCAPLSTAQCSVPLLTSPPAEGIKVGEEARPYVESQSTAGWSQCSLDTQSTSPCIYTGFSFSSILQVGRTLEMDYAGAPPRYTPSPMLNPLRRGSGLYCSLLPSLHLRPGHQGGFWSAKEEDSPRLPHVNVGPQFQAELPPLRDRVDIDTGPAETPGETLLWKPWVELEESENMQEQVEIFLDLCSSSAVPGGGTNLELALHCLSQCQGNTMAAVEMLLLSTPSLSGDYHYCGSDVWMLSERRLFNKAFAIYSKDFNLIHNMVKTKRVSQCVEFYYLSKKLPEQQKKQRERERGAEGDMSGTADSGALPISESILRPPVMDGTVSSNALATSFPCKQCGKMFYKIKSRNAHMKIHRQQQDDWRERDQNTVFAQNLTQARLAFLQSPNSHVGGISSPNLSSSGVPLFGPPHPVWDPFDLTSDSSTFYYDSEGKVMLGMTGGAKGQIRWE